MRTHASRRLGIATLVALLTLSAVAAIAKLAKPKGMAQVVQVPAAKVQPAARPDVKITTNSFCQSS